MNTKDFETASRSDYEAALGRAEKAEAESRALTIQLETCRQHTTTLREVGDQMLKDYQQTTLELERAQKACAEMRAALLFNTIAWRDRECLCDPHRIGTECHKHACIRRNEAALATDGGRDYHHADEFKPLVEVLRKSIRILKAYADYQSDSRFDGLEELKMAQKALADARQKGVIS